MKTKILTTVLILLISCSMAFAQNKTTKEKQSTSTIMEIAKDSVYYTCPMHKEVIRDKPGNCPKCGMTLEKKTIKMTGTTEATIKYTCSMHPEVIADKPGKCPKCGMDLIVKK